MELNRLKKIVRHRWIPVLVIALLGALGAVAFTGFANQQRESRWQAEAALAFQPLEGQAIADLQDSLDNNLQLATIAAQDLLTEDPTSSINADFAGARLLFSAFGETQAEAGAKAMELMQAFFSVDPLLAGQDVNARLEQVQRQADQVEAEIKALNDQITPPIPPEVQQQITFLDLQIEALRAALIELTVNQSTATGADRDAISAQRSRVETSLATLVAERAALPSGQPGTPTVQQQLELNALQSYQAQLQTTYQTLFLRSQGITQGAEIEPTSYSNLTAGPGSGVVNAAIGLLGGLLVALFGLIFINNTRKAIWMPEDLTVPLLADVPGRRTVGGVGPSWYDNTGSSPRKTSIQALRSAVEARLASTSGAVAVAGNHISAAVVHALVTDLAVSMASAGASVLLVDADLESDAALADYQIGGPSLSAVLRLSPDSLLLEREVGGIVDQALMIRSNLHVLPSGPPPATPADALAGRQFRALIQEASKRFDYVVMAVGDARSTAAQVAMQRIGRTVLVLTPGGSTEPQVQTVLSDISARQVATLGAVFVQRSEGPVAARGDRESERAVTSRPEAVRADTDSSPLSRLTNYPIPVERHSGVLPSTSLRSLADRVGSAPRVGETVDEGLGSELLDALSDVSPAEAYDAVADYLVTRVEDMMVAVPGQGDFSDGLTGALHDNGFLPLRSIVDHRSVGSWIADELQREAGGTADSIVQQMERILGFGSGAHSVSFDDWLSGEFFARHLRRTNGDPFVWHLTSHGGTAQVLAHSVRLDKTSIEILIRDVTAQLIDRLERDLKTSNAEGNTDRSRAIEEHLADVRDFEVALGWLIGVEPQGSGDNRRKRKDPGAWEWNPNWAVGYRENLAPVQRAGLLPFSVLSEEEMNTLLAVG